MVTGKKAEQNTSWPVHTPLGGICIPVKTFEERQRDGIAAESWSEIVMSSGTLFSGTDIKTQIHGSLQLCRQA